MPQGPEIQKAHKPVIVNCDKCCKWGRCGEEMTSTRWPVRRESKPFRDSGVDGRAFQAEEQLMQRS